MSQAQPGQDSVRKLSVDKERMEQINMMRRSSVEAGKFDNSASPSAPMALSALVGLGLELIFYLLLFPFVDLPPSMDSPRKIQTGRLFSWPISGNEAGCHGFLLT